MGNLPAIELLIREDFASAFLANNSTLDDAKGDFVVFAHKDICFRLHWIQHSVEASAHARARRARQIETEGPKLLRSAQDCIEQRLPSTGIGASRMSKPLLTQ
jgi:hypothetical protein